MTILNKYMLVIYDLKHNPLFFTGLDANNQPLFSPDRFSAKQLNPHEALQYEDMIAPFYPVFIRGVNSRFL